LSEGTLRQLWAGAVVMLVGLIALWSLSPQSHVPFATLSDKAAHALAYFSLALFASGITTPDRLRIVMLRCFLLGVALEIAQGLFTGDRQAEWADMAANTTGILAAWLVAGQGRAGWGLRAFARLARHGRS
jgi:VanZ family protein